MRPSPHPLLIPHRVRRYLDELGVPQPRLLAVIKQPEEMLRLVLPSSWCLKPVGGAYSEGLVIVKDGLQALTGLPW